MSRRLWATTVLVELLGIVVVSAGIGIELAMRATVGFALITAGGLVVAVGAAMSAKFLRRTQGP